MEDTNKTEVKQDKRKLLPHLFKKGQSGNPAGRPKGTISLKEYARQMLSGMNEEERQEFFEGIPKETIWKMSEGNPANATDLTSGGEKILVMPVELISKNDTNKSSEPNS